MSRGGVPEIPTGAQVNQDEWEHFYDYFGHARFRRLVRIVSHVPSEPRCEACGNPFGGWGGALMRRMGKAPSRKNPRWCSLCFETAPDGGATLTVGVMFVDVRGSTALGERETPAHVAATMNRFYSIVTQVIVRHGIVDKLIGDEVMGLYFPPMSKDGRFVDAMVADARDIVRVVHSDDRLAAIEVGIGLDVGQAFVGMVGEGEVRDFTAIGDVVNVAARLQSVAKAGEIVMSTEVAETAQVSDGEAVMLDLKGKAEPFAAHVVRT
jgi:adenylate cyclase